MTDFQYTPGGWYGIATDGALLMLPAASGPAAASALLEVLEHGAGPGRVLSALATGHGVALDELPSFALLVVEPNGLRIVIRGAIDAVVGENHRISGLDVLSWSERVFTDASRGMLLPADSTETGELLRLGRGIVRCGTAGLAPAHSADGAPAGAPLEEDPAGPPDDSTGPAAPTAPVALHYEHLFGPTVHRSIREAAMWPVLEEDVEADDPSVRGDHDGRTLPVQGAERAAEGPGVRVRLSTGESVELDMVTVIGRRPHQQSGGAPARLITVPSPNHDVSRNHVELVPGAGSVTVRDLGTTNGTRLLRPGAAAVRLEPSRPHPVAQDDTVDLGDGVTLQFEGIS